MRILFVEDNAQFRQVVIRTFLSEHEVTEAPTLEEARALLAENNYDVVLLDYHLPDGKGIELLDDDFPVRMVGRVVAVSSMEACNRRLMEAGAVASVNKQRFGLLGDVLKRFESAAERREGPLF